MGLFKVTGTIAAIGQCEFDNHYTLYAFLELIEPSGRRVMVQKVAVGNQVAPALSPGAEGEFYFDKFFVAGKRFVSQLWGVKTSDGLVAFDKDMRKRVTFYHLGWGIITLPLLGLGAGFLIVALPQLLMLIAMTGERKRLFYGRNRAEARRLRKQLAVRM